jgi:transposase
MNNLTTMNHLTTAPPSGLTIPTQPTADRPQLSLTRNGTQRKRAHFGRRVHSDEVRARALRLIKQGMTQAATARELGIKEVTVGAWFRADRAARLGSASSAPVSGIRAELLALRQSLQSRIAVLDRERDALSKTLASVRDALTL